MQSSRRTTKESKSEFDIIRTLRIYFWIIGIVVVLAILFYIVNFWSDGISSNPEHWGVFGDYIGGLLNPLIALLALVVTIQIAQRVSQIEKRYREESVDNEVKPLLFIDSAIFFSSDISKIGLTATDDIYTYETSTVPITPNSYLFKEPFFIKLENPGRGLAQNAKCVFEMDLGTCRQAIDFDNKKNIHISSQYCEVEGEEKPSASFNWQINGGSSNGTVIAKPIVNQWVGVIKASQDKSIKVPIPSQITSLFQLFNLKRKYAITNHEFPEIHLTVYYENIHGKKLETKFRIGFFNMQDQPHFSVYRLLAEQMESTTS